MARIRTVKPEFWHSESIASVSYHARLLALAILNQCDDEGYFAANVALVRATCFPFDENADEVVQSLDALVQIGYIDIRTDDAGKRIGHVCKFCEHQRINRPRESRMRDAFRDADLPESDRDDDSLNRHDTFTEGSVNPQGAFTECSPLERKGREQGTEQGTGTGNANALSVCESSGTPQVDSTKRSSRKRSTTTRPSLNDVTAHCRERGSKVDPEAFFAFYETNGWRQSNGNKIVDWKSAVVTWEKRSEKPPSSGSRPATFTEIRDTNTDRAFDEVFRGN